MSLLRTIKEDALQARKDRAAVEASLLTTLGSEAAMVGKNAGNRESTDDEVMLVVRKFLKNNGETLKVVADPAVRSQYEEERSILQRYVPAELSEDEIRAEIATLGEVGPRDMGRVMGHLTAKYPGRINGKTVTEILKG
jgi:uncharacterized protein